jgi:AraC family transcriptional regulator
MSIADRAIWIIERNSGLSLTVDAIAERCGVSRSHLASAFGSATGTSVIKYLRSRRLSEAARSLAQGASDILTVALDAGYGSHEAFTRAFRDQFGVTPESVRSSRSVVDLALTDPLQLSARAAGTLSPPVPADEGCVRLVGLREAHSFETIIAIPAQWQRFMAHYDAIPDKLDRIPTGIGWAADEEGNFSYLCGAEVSAFAECPAGLTQLAIPPHAYAVFEHATHVSTLYETYAQIWNEGLPASGLKPADAPILERHNPAFDPQTGMGGVKIWIPLGS